MEWEKSVFLTTISVTPTYPKVICEMSDGSKYELDMTPVLSHPGPLTSALRNMEMFNGVRIGEVGQCEWPNGLDIAPDKPARSGRKL